MSLRQALLRHLLANTECTLDEIQEGTGETNRKRVADNIAHLVRDGLATRQRDVVTNQPSYKLTPAGEQAALAMHKAAPHADDHTADDHTTDDAVPDGRDDDVIALAAERDGLLGLIGAKGHNAAIQVMEGLRQRLHDLDAELARHKLAMAHLAGVLHVQDHADIPKALDELLHALSTRAVMAEAKRGTPALLLIDHTDLTEVERLPEEMTPREIRAEAERAVREGHAARALAVRILGEAQRAVEWKEAA